MPEDIRGSAPAGDSYAGNVVSGLSALSRVLRMYSQIYSDDTIEHSVLRSGNKDKVRIKKPWKEERAGRMQKKKKTKATNSVRN